MADVFGLFPEGLLVPSVDDVQTQFEESLRGKFGQNLPLGDSTLIGFLTGDLSKQLALCHEILEQIFTAINPEGAGGVALRQAGLLSGFLAPNPRPSVVTVTLCGDDGSVVNPGFAVRTPDTQKVFLVEDGESVTLANLSPWTPDTLYQRGDLASNGVRCYQCSFDGTSASFGGPSSTDLDITDGSVHWTYLGEGLASGDVLMASEEIGPVVAIARGLTEIVTEQSGVNTATNLDDATLGAVDLTDEEFRLQRDREVTAPGTGTDDAIASDLAELNGVTSVTVFANEEDEVNADGVPGHSFEVLIQGGADQEIRDTILANKPSGISTHGSVVGTALDKKGKTHTIRFSRPTEKPVYVVVTLLKDPTYAGDAEVKKSVASTPRVIGRSSVAAFLATRVFAVRGVFDVPRTGSLGGVLIGLAPSPASDATILISSRELATYDVSRVSVTSSDAP